MTQTKTLLEKQEESNEQIATDTHYKVGKTVRKAIKELGGTMRRLANTQKIYQRIKEDRK